MDKKSKVGVGMIMIGMALLLISLLLFPKETRAEPKPKGTLRVALATLAQEGFLSDLGNVNQSHVFSLVYDHLFYNDEKTQPSKPIPGLAKRFEMSKDAMSYTLYLREGIPWQDTKKWGEVTAEDVKYTFERAMAKGSLTSKASLFRKTIKSMEVVDRHTLTLHLKKPAPEFWVFMTQGTATWLPILCKKYIETLGAEKTQFKPIGSGPYRLVDHKPGDSMKFEAFDKHWRVVPEFKNIIVQIVPEESTRVAMLKSGETDIAPVTIQTLADLQKQKGITAEPWPGGYTIWLCFGGMITPKDKGYKGGKGYIEGHHRTDPWKDKRVRQAMNLAIDREGIIKAIYKGVARSLPINFRLPGWDKLPPFPYDPEKAKQLLAEAGYPNGFDFTVLAVPDFVPAVKHPQVVQIAVANWEAIGLRPKIKPMDKASMIAMTRARKDVGIIYMWKGAYFDSYSGQFSAKFYPGGNAIFFLTDEIIALVDNYENEVDLKKRAAALVKLRDYLYDEVTTIPIMEAHELKAYRDAVVGEWPKTTNDRNHHLEYVRHPKPLNTWRLFTPGQ
jgi:peptide/nickel transport system substrate-binding protein